MPDTTAYVVTIGDRPLASATTLQSALDHALARRAEYFPTTTHTYHWDEYLPGQVWRLMSRRHDSKTRRSWTQYAVHVVDHITA